jgi:hypothetical protein
MVANIQSVQAPEKLQVYFGRQAQEQLRQYADLPERELFYYLINLDEFPTVGPRAQNLVQGYLQQAQALLAEPQALPQHLQTFDYTPVVFAERMQELHQRQLATQAPYTAYLTDKQLRYVLKQYTPSALLDGCWLQNISIAATNHTEIATRLFHIYADKIGNGDTAKHSGNLYQDLLRSGRICLPDLNSRLFVNRSDLGNHAFTSPVFQLALSHFPRVCLPEIIGFTLGYFFAPQDCLIQSLANIIKRQGLDDRYLRTDQRVNPAPGMHAQLVQEAVQLYLAGFSDEMERQQHWRRIWLGLVVHSVIAERWLEDLHDAINTPRNLTPQQKMLALVSEKAPHARKMHRNQKLGKQLLNDWFAQEPFDAEGLLKALAASPYININNPDQSLLLTRSISFGGPMFRIFTDAEQAVIVEWARSLASAPADSEPGAVVELKQPASRGPVLAYTQQDDRLALDKYNKCDKRELYYYLVNADLFPDILPTARKIAQQYFRRAKAELAKRKQPEQLSFFPYSHDAFEERIRRIYTTETNAYETFVPPSTVPREIMVWYTRQYAPFPMVDGSWVQHIARAGMSHTEISARLFRIYSDEVGNADTKLNHPNVYRQMLEGEGIHMPPTDTLDFAMQPAIRDFAFDLPLLTLSVSLFPKAFLPEIIGVNLAIELSGLGKGYMQIIDELRFWKIDPYFFTLHLTIDNIASGHTAVAMETVHLYLDQILAHQGREAKQQHWERIWSGYLAFKQSMTRFDSTLEREAGFRFLLPIIRLMRERSKEKKRLQAHVAAKAQK